MLIRNSKRNGFHMIRKQRSCDCHKQAKEDRITEGQFAS